MRRTTDLDRLEDAIRSLDAAIALIDQCDAGGAGRMAEARRLANEAANEIREAVPELAYPEDYDFGEAS